MTLQPVGHESRIEAKLPVDGAVDDSPAPGEKARLAGAYARDAHKPRELRL
jgi:hypothetical protein